ncbi:MAG: hypothetical protein GXP63_00220 [DPANN group archaeon]|nr:hypothetical protein [DPANN group archaeon]
MEKKASGGKKDPAHRSRQARPTIRKDTPLERILRLAPACDCPACTHGCSMGSGILIGDDLHRLAVHLKVPEERLKEEFLEEVEQFDRVFFRPKLRRKNGLPYGPCIFLQTDGHCRVHPAKPLQCRISTGCKDYGEKLSLWFLLNHLLDIGNPESVRQYHLYLQSGGKTISGGSLAELIPSRKKRDAILSFKEL